jgi:hypothetical protein
VKFDIGEYAFGVHGPPEPMLASHSAANRAGEGALAFTLTEPLLVRARFVARLGDDGGTAEYGIAPSRYLHQRLQARARGRSGATCPTTMLVSAPVKIDGRKVWDIRHLDLAFDDLPRENPAPNSWKGV